MALAIFDLDNTLLAGDSDYLWGIYLCDQGMVDRDYYERENERFYQEYTQGKLDIMEFLAFSLKPLSQIPLDELLRLRSRFLENIIIPLIHADAIALVDRHRDAGDTLLVVTATNSFVTAPIVARFGIEHLIATEPETVNGAYTGGVAGIPSYQQGKVDRLAEWLSTRDENLEGSWFYSDSHNDLPLLRQVTHPVAVNPDAALQQEAQRQHWPIIHLQGK